MASKNQGFVEILREFNGDYGATVITGTDPISGSFGCLQIVTATVMATGTNFNGTTNPFGGTTLPALLEVRGLFTDIELVSGVAIAYKYK